MPEFVVSDATTPSRSETIVEEEDEDEDEDEEEEEEEEGLERGVHRRILPPPTPPLMKATPTRRGGGNQEVLPSPSPGNSPYESYDFFFGYDIPGGGGAGGGLRVPEAGDGVLDGRFKRADVRRMEYQPTKALEKVYEVPEVRVARRGKQVGVASGGVGEAKRGGKSVSLVQVFSELDDYFLRASEIANEVSKMLEATRLHYHSSSANNCGHINHSERVMNVITWNRSFRGLQNSTDDKYDDFDSEEHETHATVLDKLLAWEKKLYDEVKAGEIMKFEYQKKVGVLNKQKKRGANSETLEKTKASLSHLHTRYIVDMQSLDSTISEINRLRDEQLYPKLMALVDGFAKMWGEMQSHHEKQSKIAGSLNNVDISQCVKETSGQHFEQTEQLWIIVQEWHAQFDRMVSNQKRYIKDLNSWLKLNIIPIESNLKEKVSSPPRSQNPPIQILLTAWHDCLEKLPEDHAKTSIYNFAGVLHTIVQQQDDELKLKARCEEARKDVACKTRAYEDWYSKYMQRRTPPDEVDPDMLEDFARDEAVIDREAVVEAAKKRLEDEEVAYEKQCQQVREKSLTHLKTRLPELFWSLFDFAGSCSEMYNELKSISRPRNHQERSA